MYALTSTEDTGWQGFSEGGAGYTRLYQCSAAEHRAIEAAIGMSIKPATLRKAVDQAARDAVRWCELAASRLQVSPRSARTRRLFREAFGTTPEFVPAWKKPSWKWVDRGDLVAKRLRAVAKILKGGHIRFYCWGSPAHCPECTTVPPTYHACSSWGKRYVICLGRGFWRNVRDRKRNILASTLVHEALHIYFAKLIAHKGRYTNSACYERFVLRMNNRSLDAYVKSTCPAAAP